MSALSDNLLIVAILGYLAAMILHAAEYAFGNKSQAAPAEVRELVAVGGGAGADVVVEVAGARRTGGNVAGRLGLGAVVTTWLAVAVHFGVAATRGLAAG